jgi:hypothetical protein
MLEAANLTKDHMSREEPETRLRREEESTQSAMTLGHRTLKIHMDALELPMGELHEQVNMFGHLNIVVSRLSMRNLLDLQA